jgi:hypothetical protein
MPRRIRSAESGSSETTEPGVPHLAGVDEGVESCKGVVEHGAETQGTDLHTTPAEDAHLHESVKLQKNGWAPPALEATIRRC